MMGTLTQHDVCSMLEWLDAATRAIGDRPGLESDAAWRIRMARNILVCAAVQPVAVEMREAA